MKEQYMEQTRTLEQLQLQMKQQLLEKQAQLLLQLKTLDNQAGSDQDQEDAGIEEEVGERQLSNSSRPSQNQHTTANNSTTELNAGSDYKDNLNRKSDVMSNSVTSADESLNGNISQGSSHDTWDSSNAFAHERPVLTGSERSTPTPVLPSTNSSNDLELISQSIHIPCDESGSQTAASPAVVTSSSQPLGSNLNASIAVANGVDGQSIVTATVVSKTDVSANLADTPRELSGGAVGQNDEDDDTPRNFTATKDSKVCTLFRLTLCCILIWSQVPNFNN